MVIKTKGNQTSWMRSSALRFIITREGSLTLSQLAAIRLRSNCSITKLIDGLEQDGLVKRYGNKLDYGMGLSAGLFPCPEGKTITEINAVEILSGATAVPVASGGLGGAEGAMTLIIKGTNEQVRSAIEFIEQSKESRLPPLRLCNCSDCPIPDCRFPVGDKHWV